MRSQIQTEMGGAGTVRRFGRTAVLCGFLLGVLLVPGRAAAQTPGEDRLAQVRGAFVRGDAQALLQEAADRLEISLFNASTLYSRAQAMYVMEDFFRQYPPLRFTFREDRKDEGNWFAAGVYVYAPTGRTLLVYVRLRRKADRWEVREIRIEQPVR